MMNITVGVPEHHRIFSAKDFHGRPQYVPLFVIEMLELVFV